MNHTDALIKELSDQKYALDQSSIVAATDRAGTITYVNEKFCEISGYSASELLGQNHRILKSNFHSPEFFTEMWSTISSGKVWRGEVCNRTKSNQLYWVNTTVVPFVGEDGRPYQYLSIRHDITAQKEAERIVLEQQARLVAASKLSALGEVSAAITHEINNPLGVILGRCEMLRLMLDSGDLEIQELRKIAEMIEKTGHRIETIIRSMRTFTHGSESELIQPAKIFDIVQGALDLVTQRFKDHGIQFEPPVIDKKLSLDCRPTQVLQILVNLLNNAHDAVFKLSEKWVRLEVSDQGSKMIFKVIDSGGGIPLDVKKKLFTPFFTTKDIQYGTGLGLSISKRLAEKHGGTLMLDESCKTTSFVLELPKKQPN